MIRAIGCLVLLALLALPSVAWAKVIEVSYFFDTPVLAPLDDGSVEVTLNGAQRHLAPGEPILPQRTARVLIPPGHEVTDVSVVTDMEIILAVGVVPAYAPAYRYTGRDSDDGYVALPKPEIYQSALPFPRQVFRQIGMQRKMGAQILPLVLYPVTYLPETGTLLFTPRMTVRIFTAEANHSSPLALPYRGLPGDDEEIARAVDNPEMLSVYRPSRSITDAYDMLILAPTQFTELCQQYAAHKEETFGIKVKVADLEEAASAPGKDLQAKIRNYLRAQYEELGIRFVLLVGDADLMTNTIPARYSYVLAVDPDDGTVYQTNLMISDIYYGCLDGSWNSNGDGRFGEVTDGEDGGDVDLMFDVHVGRFMVDNTVELQNVIEKHMRFDNQPAPRKAVFVGEKLDDITSGGLEMEEVYKHTNGLDVTRLYDYLGTADFPHILQAINSNEHQWLDHDGHGELFADMLFVPFSVWMATNETLFLGYTQACYAGSFDGRLSGNLPMFVDCIVEQFTVKSHHFAFAYIANTRYGFYFTGRVDGPSNVYNWEFADAVFNQKIANIGWANDKSREDCLGMLEPESPMRYCYYELTLFGDPHTPLRFEDQPIDDDTADDDLADDDAAVDDDSSSGNTDDDAAPQDNGNDDDAGCGC